MFKLIMPNHEEQKERLLALVRDALQHDKALREQYQIGEKFRFIRDRLQSLLSHVEAEMQVLQQKEHRVTSEIKADEVLVYVYLYNAQGLLFRTWQKMLNPSVFYEYSVNRPIYAEQSHVESFIRSRKDKPQHAYLTIVVNKQDILSVAAADISKDAVGQTLIKIREGALHAEKLVSFNHNQHEYTLNEAGELVKKE